MPRRTATARDEALLARAGRQMSRLRDIDPEAWAAYLDEGRQWEEGTGAPVDPRGQAAQVGWCGTGPERMDG
jgi:hypothetical protein